MQKENFKAKQELNLSGFERVESLIRLNFACSVYSFTTCTFPVLHAVSLTLEVPSFKKSKKKGWANILAQLQQNKPIICLLGNYISISLSSLPLFSFPPPFYTAFFDAAPLLEMGACHRFFAHYTHFSGCVIISSSAVASQPLGLSSFASTSCDSTWNMQTLLDAGCRLMAMWNARDGQGVLQTHSLNIWCSWWAEYIQD